MTAHLCHTFQVPEIIVRLLAGVKHLPDEDPKAPDIGGGGEAALTDALRGHPADRAGYVRLGLVDRVVLGEFSEKTEAGNFAKFAVAH